MEATLMMNPTTIFLLPYRNHKKITSTLTKALYGMLNSAIRLI